MILENSTVVDKLIIPIHKKEINLVLLKIGLLHNIILIEEVVQIRRRPRHKIHISLVNLWRSNGDR